MSPELETLDQLLIGDMPLSIIRPLFNDDLSFRIAITRMIQAGDVELLDEDSEPMQIWRCREIMDTSDVSEILHRHIAITSSGARKIG